MKKILSVFILLIFAASAFAAPPALPPDGPYTAVDCNQAQFYKLGSLCVDSSGKLWKGTGSGVVEVGNAVSGLTDASAVAITGGTISASTISTTGNLGVGISGQTSRVYIRQNTDDDLLINIHSGATLEKRAYFVWNALSGAERWRMGKNAFDTFILFESVTGVHRLRMFNTTDKSTELNGVGTFGVRIGYMASDQHANLGTGGLEVYNGGISPQKLFFVNSSGVGITYPDSTVGGGYVRKVVSAVSATLSGASGSIAVNVPTGSRILGVQLRVDTAITSGDGATSWTAAYVNTPTTAICSGQAFTKNTKFNAIHPAYELTTDVVTITITPNSGTFSAGVVRAIVYYEALDAMADAP